MKNIDRTVKTETGYIAVSVLIFSVILQAVFLIIGKWDYTVLLGNILSALSAILNFFLMGITVQSATQSEERDAKNKMKLSQLLRLLFLFAVAVIGISFSCFNMAAVLIPLFFPRIAVAFRLVLMKRDRKNET